MAEDKKNDRMTTMGEVLAAKLEARKRRAADTKDTPDGPQNMPDKKTR